jgi:hypothetical protein
VFPPSEQLFPFSEHVFPLSEQLFPFSELVFPPSEQLFPFSELVFPLSEQLFPFSELVFPFSEQLFPFSEHVFPFSEQLFPFSERQQADRSPHGRDGLAPFFCDAKSHFKGTLVGRRVYLQGRQRLTAFEPRIFRINTNAGRCEHGAQISRFGREALWRISQKMILLSVILSALSPALTETPLQQNPRGSSNPWRVDLRLDSNTTS